uniref:Obg domain-containing protein n=1 Tax=Panagrolaimus sp. PS1159 TaxID=55785 RepID=A0AC35F1V2_9BILA
MVFSLLSQGTKQTLAIEGHNITLSAANREINERIKRNTKIKSVLLRAKHILILDQDVILPSVTFTCAAAEVVVTKPVKINLSGKDAEVDQTKLKPAKSGKQKGEKGEDGKDGNAGHPSGNFAIFAKKLKGKENLNLILNGGNGTNGQDGGDSAEGEDGVGENFERLDSLKYEFEQGFKRFGRIVSAGIGSSLFNKKVKVKMENGSTEVINEAPYYLSLHTIDFVKGSDGKRGECGGKNGLGGEGGKKGKCMIKINGIEHHVVKIESHDGQAGQNGLPGKNGGYGLEGWDIAKATKTFAKTRKYGTSFNEKLTVEYTTVKTDETFRVVAEDEGPESKRYAYIKSRKCEKKVLQDHELRTECKDESERSGEAIAQEADAIETEALDQDYEIPLNGEVDAEVEEEIEEENDFERIIDFCVDLIDDEYVAKERPKEQLLSSKDIENQNLLEQNSRFWNSTIDFTVENLFEKYENTWIEKNSGKNNWFLK